MALRSLDAGDTLVDMYHSVALFAKNETVQREDISMCGCGPAVATLTAAQDLGATRAELLRYATSADILGDRDEVVGYAGMIFR